MDKELEEQMKMLEGIDGFNSQPGVETASTLLGETPFIPQQSVSGVQQTSIQQTSIPQSQNYAQTSIPQSQNYAQPVQQTSVQPNQTQQINMNETPVFVNLASNSYQTQTDFLSLKDGEKSRVTIANLNFMRNHIHYIEGLGKIRCLSQYDDYNKWPINRAACCQFIDNKTGKQQNAKNRLLVPVIEYPVSKTDGKTIVQGAKPKLKMWDMNYVEEKQLLSILENYKVSDDWNSIDLTQFDLSLTKGKSGEYSTITLINVPSWRQNFSVDINAEISKINQEFYKVAFNESARTVSEDSVRNALNKSNQDAILAQQLANQPVPDMNTINLNM